MTFSRAHIISTLDYLDAALACLPAENERSGQEHRVGRNIQLAKARIMNACVSENVEIEAPPKSEKPI